MVDARVDDVVVCKIKDATIVSTSEAYDEKKSFQIIGKNFQGWYIYVPPYITIKDTIPITYRNYISLGVDQKFVGWDAFFVTSSFIVSVSERKSGMVCARCNEYFEYAEANQEDGSMICFSCRVYPKYRSWVDDDDY